MRDDDLLEATIDEMVDTFRSALIALLPAANRSKLTWADENQHRDWESLAESAFNTFVRGPIQADITGRSMAAPLARYDIDSDSYASQS